MILTGKEDLRVIKTIKGIKASFEELICEKDYERITVKELCERAEINKKTFYHYYETLDHLLKEMQEELSSGFLERIKDFSLPKDLDLVNREFFLYAQSQGTAYEKITCGGNYRTIRDEMTFEVNRHGWSASNSRLASIAPNAEILTGLAILGEDCQNNRSAVANEISEWVKALGVL